MYQYNTLYEQELALYEYCMTHDNVPTNNILEILGFEMEIMHEGLVELGTIVRLEGEWYVFEPRMAKEQDIWG